MTLFALLLLAVGVAYAFGRGASEDRASVVNLQKRAADVSALARRLYDEGRDPSTVVALQKASATLYAHARQ